MMDRTSGSLTSSASAAGNCSRSDEQISAGSPADVARSLDRRTRRRRSLEFTAVSSSRSKGWFASTTSPSLTSSSRMIPPSRCCTCLFCPVATKEPDATTALASGAIAAHAPNPQPHISNTKTPSTIGTRALHGTSRYHVSMPAQPRIIAPLPCCRHPRVRAAADHSFQYLEPARGRSKDELSELEPRLAARTLPPARPAAQATCPWYSTRRAVE